MLKMSALLILSILVPFSLFSSSQGCGITTYWGQNGFEGDLSNACNSGNYKYIALAFLTTFGSGQTPVLNLAGHCDPPAGTCTRFSTQIRACQNQGIKILLSLGGALGSYNISSPEDAREVARYIWETYLRGSGGSFRPLGDAALDGVDFDIEYPGSTLYWDELAKALAAYNTTQSPIYLSAAPQCPLPDRNLDAAIRTGLFDYVWVQFYNNPPCDYRGGLDSLLKSWNEWSSYLPTGPAGNQLFLGLPADPSIPGYIPPVVVKNDILPVISKSANYGGVMLWNRYLDVQTGYSSVIYPAVCDNTATINNEEYLIKQVTFE